MFGSSTPRICCIILPAATMPACIGEEYRHCDRHARNAEHPCPVSCVLAHPRALSHALCAAPTSPREGQGKPVAPPLTQRLAQTGNEDVPAVHRVARRPVVDAPDPSRPRAQLLRLPLRGANAPLVPPAPALTLPLHRAVPDPPRVRILLCCSQTPLSLHQHLSCIFASVSCAVPPLVYGAVVCVAMPSQ
eukprot:5573604-Pleurochrysis_carterae.AAC.1